jgi:hypothetical protein
MSYFMNYSTEADYCLIKLETHDQGITCPDLIFNKVLLIEVRTHLVQDAGPKLHDHTPSANSLRA